jgi:AraC-like DNA-binding protein
MLENLHIDAAYDGFLFLAEAVRNPPVLRPHRHLELELNLVVQGEVTYVHEGQRYCFSKGSLLWLFPAQEHQLIDRTADAAYYVAVFTPRMLKRACRGERYTPLQQQQLSESGILHTELRAEEFDLLRTQMETLVLEGLDGDLLNREAGFGQSVGFQFAHNDPDWLNAGLRQLLLSSWRAQQGHRPGGREVDLHPAVRLTLELMNNVDLEDDLDSLAEAVGVSPSYLSRTFRREIGVPLTRYRNSIRLSRFWKAYRVSHGRSLLDAALAAGFGSYAQFYRVYREAYGQGPRETML